MANVHTPLHGAGGAEWNNGLFAIGGNCLYACCCPACALASARSRFDDSNCFFNLLCVTPAVAQNLVREGYGIEGDCMSDILVSACCTPCVANRLLTEVDQRGPLKKGMC